MVPWSKRCLCIHRIGGDFSAIGPGSRRSPSVNFVLSPAGPKSFVEYMPPFMTDSIAASPEPRLNRRQAAKIRTRQKVLEAARSLFAERGYEPATIRDIAKGAGMSTGAVFANFQDKAELFEAVLTEDMTRLAEVVEAGAPQGEPVRDRLVGALSAGYHSSLDQLPHMVVAALLFGHQLLLPVPDIDRTDYLVIQGGNPLVSNGSLMSAPDLKKRLEAIQKRGGQVVVGGRVRSRQAGA